VLRVAAFLGLIRRRPLSAMRRGFSFLAIAAIAAGAHTASASEGSAEIAARLGYGVPFGNVENRHGLTGPVGDPLDQTVGGSIPIWIDAGYRFDPRWYAGGFVAFAPAWPGGALASECSSNGVSCQPFDLRTGFEVQYHVRPAERWDPWLGAGLGVEWLVVTFPTQGVQGPPLWASGFELLNFQAGIDARVEPHTAIGPFLALTASEYIWNSAGPSSNKFDGTAPHGWFVFGVRALFDFAPQGLEH
jgi:hypothetical protein